MSTNVIEPSEVPNSSIVEKVTLPISVWMDSYSHYAIVSPWSKTLVTAQVTLNEKTLRSLRDAYAYRASLHAQGLKVQSHEIEIVVDSDCVELPHLNVAEYEEGESLPFVEYLSIYVEDDKTVAVLTDGGSFYEGLCLVEEVLVPLLKKYEQMRLTSGLGLAYLTFKKDTRTEILKKAYENGLPDEIFGDSLITKTFKGAPVRRLSLRGHYCEVVTLVDDLFVVKHYFDFCHDEENAHDVVSDFRLNESDRTAEFVFGDGEHFEFRY